MSYVIDPQAVLDYALDWTRWLGEGETITSHTITATTGVTVDSHTESDGLVTLWLSGAVLGTNTQVACHITTSAGRQDTRRIGLSVRDR